MELVNALVHAAEGNGPVYVEQIDGDWVVSNVPVNESMLSYNEEFNTTSIQFKLPDSIKPRYVQFKSEGDYTGKNINQVTIKVLKAIRPYPADGSKVQVGKLKPYAYA